MNDDPPSSPLYAGVNRSPAAQRSEEEQSTLLVVEDEPDDYLLLKRALRKAGAVPAVRWARTAAEALAVLAEIEPGGNGICVVADVSLPGIDGFDLLRSIKSRISSKRVKFAFLTGRRDPLTEERARASGADAFYVKPTDAEELINIARALYRLAAQF